METLFKVGDEVEIIKYGHITLRKEENKELEPYDISPELIGKQGIIIESHKTQGIDNYSIDGIAGKTAWFNNGQLKLIYRPEYRGRATNNTPTENETLEVKLLKFYRLICASENSEFINKSAKGYIGMIRFMFEEHFGLINNK